jgi:tRNA G10  N-methylase Trm11
MKSTYFSTFISGAQQIVQKALQKRSRVKIIDLLDGLVVYQTDYNEKDLREIHFFNNTFRLLGSYRNVHDFPDFVKAVAKDKTLGGSLRNLFTKPTSYRLFASEENRSINPGLPALEGLEQKIAQNRYLKVDFKKYQQEFWLLWRREKIGFFGVRITGKKPTARKLKAGQLRPELAHLICLASRPGPQEVVLDPFAGQGGLLNERIRAFPFQKALGLEEDEKVASDLKSKLFRNYPKEKVQIRKESALQMSFLEENSIDKIITDPPWGKFKALENPREFYTQMLREFYRVLKPKGLAVILMGAGPEFSAALEDLQQSSSHTHSHSQPQPQSWKISSQHHLLVSGQKATLWVLKK